MAIGCRRRNLSKSIGRSLDFLDERVALLPDGVRIRLQCPHPRLRFILQRSKLRSELLTPLVRLGLRAADDCLGFTPRAGKHGFGLVARSLDEVYGLGFRLRAQRI